MFVVILKQSLFAAFKVRVSAGLTPRLGSNDFVFERTQPFNPHGEYVAALNERLFFHADPGRCTGQDDVAREQLDTLADVGNLVSNCVKMI